MKRHLISTGAVIAALSIASVGPVEAAARMSPKSAEDTTHKSGTSKLEDDHKTDVTGGDTITIRVNGTQVTIPRAEAEALIEELIAKAQDAEIEVTGVDSLNLGTVRGAEAARTSEMPENLVGTTDRESISDSEVATELPRTGVGTFVGGVIGVGALGYGLYSFISSRRSLREAIRANYFGE